MDLSRSQFQRSIERGCRRPADENSSRDPAARLAKSVPIIYKDNKTRGGTGGFPPRPRLGQASCPDFMPVDRKFRNRFHPVDYKIKKVRREEGENILYEFGGRRMILRDRWFRVLVLESFLVDFSELTLWKI